MFRGLRAGTADWAEIAASERAPRKCERTPEASRIGHARGGGGGGIFQDPRVSAFGSAFSIGRAGVPIQGIGNAPGGLRYVVRQPRFMETALLRRRSAESSSYRARNFLRACAGNADFCRRNGVKLGDHATSAWPTVFWRESLRSRDAARTVWIRMSSSVSAPLRVSLSGRLQCSRRTQYTAPGAY